MNINKIQKLINYMTYVDQYYRKNNLPPEEVALVDATSTNLLRYIVEKIGWPTIEKVGKKASHNAWILIQHSQNLNFQETCLKLMKNINVDKRDFAFLTDRIGIKKLGFQTYGTQVKTYLKEGKYITECLPIKNPRDVEKRRKKMGLDSIPEQNSRNAIIFKKYLLKNRV